MSTAATEEHGRTRTRIQLVRYLAAGLSQAKSMRGAQAKSGELIEWTSSAVCTYSRARRRNHP